jgi:hypothetical protein
MSSIEGKVVAITGASSGIGESTARLLGRDRQIRLLNGGAVVPSETLETLRKPFVRGCSVGAGGGLGLAIVDSVMKQIGGSLTLISPIMAWRRFRGTAGLPRTGLKPASLGLLGNGLRYLFCDLGIRLLAASGDADGAHDIPVDADWHAAAQ